jgi:hypothetical protein
MEHDQWSGGENSYPAVLECVIKRIPAWPVGNERGGEK